MLRTAEQRRCRTLTNGIAYARIQRNGQRRPVSLKTKDLIVAKARLRTYLKEIDGQGCSTGQYTVREAVDKFIEEHLPNLKRKAIQRYDTNSR